MTAETLITLQPNQLPEAIAKGYRGGNILGDDNNPTLKSLAYQRQQANVRRCIDFYEGQSAWIYGENLDQIIDDLAEEYLPLMPAETPKEWYFRLRRSLFVNFFKPAVKIVSSLLSKWVLSGNVPESVVNASKNFDKRGTSIRAFFLEADRMAVRDGFVGVLTLYPNFGEIPNRAVEQQLDLRPYSVLIPRLDIDIKDYEYTNDGSVLLKHVTIDRSEVISETRYKQSMKNYCWEYELIKVQEEDRIYYVVMRSVTCIETNDKGEKEYVQVEAPKPLLDTNGLPLSQIPFVLYSVTSANPWDTIPPLLDLQQKNHTYYQVFSDWLATVRKMQPTAVREHIDFIPEKRDPLSTGGASVIETVLTQVGAAKVYYLQADANSVAPMIQALDRLEALIKQTVFNFLGESFVQQSATEVSIKAGQNEAGLQEYEVNKESCSQQIFCHWAMWEGEDVNADHGTIDVDLSFILAPADVNLIRTIFEVINKGLTEEAATEILHRVNFLPKDQKIVAIAPPVEMATANTNQSQVVETENDDEEEEDSEDDNEEESESES
jgi:hypothetical protein